MPREGKFFDLFNAHAERGRCSERLGGALGIAGNILWAWVLTIPCSAFMSGLAWWVGRQLF